MNIKTFIVGSFGENTYVIFDKNDKSNDSAIIIDPGDENGHVIDFLKSNNLNPIKILLTHSHIDHIIGIQFLYRYYQPEIYLHEDDHWIYKRANEQASFFGLSDVESVDVTNLFKEEIVIPFSTSQFEVIHTPGHTPGSVCYYSRQDKIIFTGDTLFKRSIGRTDLLGGNSSSIIDSIRNKLFVLDDNVIIYPGHMDKSSIGEEKLMNPFAGL